jgi:circadian clock protein KaiC
MVERKTTGIPKLDDMVEGGFKAGTINMLEGEAGSGKSTLAVQYLIAGLNAGEAGIYLSVEETKTSYFENMARFGFDLQKYEDSGKLLFYECSAQKLKDFLEKGSLGIEAQIRDMQARRLVLDSISAFVLLYDNEARQRTAIQRLFEKLKSWNLTTLIVCESSDDYSKFGLPYIVDGWIRLYYKKVGNERVRTIEVLKMRGTKHKSQELVYRIEEKGINLYPNERIFEVKD